MIPHQANLPGARWRWRLGFSTDDPWPPLFLPGQDNGRDAVFGREIYPDFFRPHLTWKSVRLLNCSECCESRFLWQYFRASSIFSSFFFSFSLSACIACPKRCLRYPNPSPNKPPTQGVLVGAMRRRLSQSKEPDRRVRNLPKCKNKVNSSPNCPFLGGE